MRTIGITGGIGCGKSAVLSYLSRAYRCEVIQADEVAARVKEPGQDCYQELVALLGRQVLETDGRISRSRMSDLIFKNEALRNRVNGIIHPAVKRSIRTMIQEEAARGILDFLFVEAALLIEGGYEAIVDELWYIHADLGIRVKRLKQMRGYRKEKIDAIMASQLSEEIFRSRCQVVIENNGLLEEAYKQIDEKLGEYLCQK